LINFANSADNARHDKINNLCKNFTKERLHATNLSDAKYGFSMHTLQYSGAAEIMFAELCGILAFFLCPDKV
jgi:hypothetical protein